MYEVEVVQRFEALETLREAWDRLVSETGRYVYLTLDWCRVWWGHYGDGRELAVFLFREGTQLVGIVPMFVERARLGPVSIRRAKLLGSDHTFAICDPPVKESCARFAFSEVLRRLVTEHGCEVVVFGRLSGGCAVRDEIRSAMTEGGPCRLACEEHLAPLTLFDLPSTFEDYLACLKSGDRSNLRRRRRLLEKAFAAVENDVVASSGEIEDEFCRFQELHDEQWRQEGKLGHFGDWPKARSFSREVVSALARLGRARLYRTLVDGCVISYEYALLFEGVLSWVLPARSPADEWNRYALGRLGLAAMIESAMSEGARHVEAGPGHYPYKLAMGGYESELRSIVAVAATRGAVARERMYRMLAGLLDRLYYRIFFLKVAPALPWRPSPLWRCWIRSRF